MTIAMTIQEQIRRLDAAGVSGRQIAKDLGISRDSVSKYVGVQDFSPKPPVTRRRPGASVLTELTSVIDGWLTEDAGRPRKQRHTAKRVFDRLVDEHGYGGSYSPVQRYVKAYQAARRSAAQGYSELTWSPGVAQVDFGQAQAVIAGVMQVLHILVVTFPFSNMRYAQAYPGETSECLCHGLRAIFEHIGGAVGELIFDNATSAGRRRGQQISESALFAAFKAHYRSAARYCNPYSGHEKGSVENAVGFLRRNLMVPEPKAASLAGLNAMLLTRCDEVAAADHYRKQTPISELFRADQAALLELPGIGFDPVRYQARRTDKTGNLVIEGHTYSAGPAMAGRSVTVGVRFDRIEFLDDHARPVMSLPRVYGHHPETVFDPAALLPLLVAKPGTWRNSVVRAQVSDPVRDWLDSAATRDRRDMLAAIHAATGPAGFGNAVAAAETIIIGGHPEPAAIGMLARRIAAGAEPLASTVDLRVYDTLAPTTATVASTAETLTATTGTAAAAAATAAGQAATVPA